MKSFEVLDISGDVGVRAFGKTIIETFLNASLGLYSLITNLEHIEEKKSIEIAVGSSDPEGLLVKWLNELIFHFDAYGFIGRKIIITELSLPPQGGGKDNNMLPYRGETAKETCRLKAVVHGEEFDPRRHEGKLLIKAATYHRLRIEKKGGLWEADVIFDI